MKPILLLVITMLLAGKLISQNSCETAIQAFSGTTTVDEDAGTDAPMPENCLWLNGGEMFLWYYFIAENDTAYTITTNISANTGLDTRIGVYSGTCGDLECVGFADDGNGNFLSTVQVEMTEGELYYIVFDTYWGSSEYTIPGEFVISESEIIVDPDPDPIDGLIPFTTSSLSGAGFSDCIVDMNGDFLDDIVFVNGNTLEIFYQQTDGDFISEEFDMGTVANAPSWSIAAGDIDGNGYNDLVFGGGSGASMIWADDDGNGYSETHDNNYIFSQRTNMVDINNDGNLDVFVCHDIDANVYYLNDGSGNLVHYQGGLGENGGNYGSVWIDYDNDCDMDLFIAKCGSDNIDQLHRNDNGEFTFIAPAAGIDDGSQTWSSAWADYDNDGDMDAFIGASSTWNGAHKFYINNGDGTFTNITAGSGFDLVTSTGIENYPGDFNNDGWVDVLGLGDKFMINNGDMTFTESSSPFYPAPAGDLNNDGYIDFFSAGTIYYNDIDTNNWLKVVTIGTESNKNGIGARVTITSALGQQIRDVRSGEAFSAMQTLNTHFGLGQDTEIASVHVCWPSGIEDVINNPPINSTLVITEGMTINVAEQATLKLNVFPNPATDMLRISADGLNSTDRVRIYDVHGALVMDRNLGSGQLQIDQLPAGLYLVEAGASATAARATFIKE
jgi:hypothetical protein